MDEPNTVRIVLLGKTGCGKSSLAHTIFGENVFKDKHLLHSQASICEETSGSINGRKLTVVETPGFFSPGMSESELKSEMLRCVTECAPGPHAFLIVLKVERFTEQERHIIRQILEYFSAEVFKYSAVVFTHGDQLPENMRIEAFISDNKNLKDLVEKCGSRCHVVDNKYWKNNQQDEYRSNQVQVEQLLNTIDNMKEHGGCYSIGMLEEWKRQQRQPSLTSFLIIMTRWMKYVTQHPVRTFAGVATIIAQHTNIVLMGKTGTGKSSLARTILGEKEFQIHHTSVSGTSECQTETRQVGDGNITVIDTPGFCDNRMSDDALKPKIIDAIIESSEGIDAFLILFKVERFTEQENEIVSKIKDYFSEEAFKHAVVVFTHGDQLPDSMKIEEFVSDNQCLCDLLEKCGNRCCVVDNKYWKNNQQDEYRNNQVQVAKLLQTVKEKMISEGRYTNEMLQEVKRMISQQVQRIYRSAVDMSNEDIMNQAKSNVSGLLRRLAGITTGVLLGAFLGVPCMVAEVILKLKKNKKIALHGLPAIAPADAAAVSGITASVSAASGVAFDVAAASGVALPVSVGVYAAAGAAVGGYIGYREAGKAKSVNEAVKNSAEALIKPIKQVWKGKHHT